MKRIAQIGIGVGLLLAVAAMPAGAQSQAPASSQNSAGSSSLGDYARQVRKSPGSATKPKVFDNDNLPTQDKLSIVGATPASTEPRQQESSSASAPSGDNKAATETKAASSDNGALDEAAKQAAWKQWGDKIAAQKSTIELLGRELDVLQREYQVRAAAMYADVGNRLRNSGDWDKQDAQYKQQIADKQKAVDDAKQKLDDILEEARKAGVPSSVREP
jgi:hypothetical protein